MAGDSIRVVRFQENPFETVVEPLLPPAILQTLGADLDVVIAVHQVVAAVAVHQTDQLVVSVSLPNELVPGSHLKAGDLRHLEFVFELRILLPHVSHHHLHIGRNSHPKLVLATIVRVRDGHRFTRL